VITYSPLDGGFLAGKYRTPEDLAGDNRIAHFQKRMRGSFDPHQAWVRRKLDLIPELMALAAELGVTMPQMAVAFAVQHPGVTAAIIGPRTMEHLEGVLGGGDLKLSAETLDRIDELVPPGVTLNPFTDMPSGLTKAAIRRG
jgi:aryl-alcohol dehydrogenase-like predicted oxidoreductase